MAITTFYMPETITPNSAKWAMHYWKLCNRAVERKLVDVFTENHHVYPKCMVGDNNITVELTAKEHYLAHQLLVKMYPNNNKLVFAAFCMTNGNCGRNPRVKMREYSWLKRKRADAARDALKGKPGKPHTEETKTRIRDTLKRTRPGGYVRSAEEIENMKIGLANSLKQKNKICYSPLGIKHSEETRLKMSISRKKLITPEYCKAQSERMKRIWAERSAGAASCP